MRNNEAVRRPWFLWRGIPNRCQPLWSAPSPLTAYWWRRHMQGTDSLRQRGRHLKERRWRWGGCFGLHATTHWYGLSRWQGLVAVCCQRCTALGGCCVWTGSLWPLLHRLWHMERPSDARIDQGSLRRGRRITVELWLAALVGVCEASCTSIQSSTCLPRAVVCNRIGVLHLTLYSRSLCAIHMIWLRTIV